MLARAKYTSAAVFATLTLLLLTGCSSDPTAPQDQITLEPDEAAIQTGYLAWALTRMCPELLEDPSSGSVIQKSSPDMLVFTGAVTGTCEIWFETAGGATTTWDLASWAYCETAADTPLSFTPVAGSEAVILLEFDMAASINRVPDPDTATISGTGIVHSGSLTTAFALDDFVVPTSEPALGWPTSGTLSTVIGGLPVVVTFDGDSSVTATVDGQSFTVSLVTGETTPLP